MGKHNKIHWTKEQEEYIKNNHCKILLSDIARNMNMNYYAIRSKARSMGLIRDVQRQHIPIKYSHDYKYFEKPNLVSAVIAGRIGTDGCICKRKKRVDSYRLDYSCKIDDEYIVDDLIKELKYTGTKKYYTAKSDNKFIKTSTGKPVYTKMVKLSISTFSENAKFLEKHYNITPNKSLTLQPPNLNNKYLNLAYIIGNIDGDGSIGWVKHKNGHQYPTLFICSSSYNFIKWIVNLYNEYFPLISNNHSEMSKILTKKRGDYNLHYRHTISGLRAAIIIDYLRQFPLFKLPRKWDQPEILSYIESKKSEFPHLFQKLDLAEIQHLLPPKFPNTLVLV
jgi:hypothetical protein